MTVVDTPLHCTTFTRGGLRELKITHPKCTGQPLWHCGGTAARQQGQTADSSAHVHTRAQPWNQRERSARTLEHSGILPGTVSGAEHMLMCLSSLVLSVIAA